MNDNMSDYKRMLSQKLFDPQKVKDDSWSENRRLIEQFNATPNDRHKEAMA